MNFTYILFSIEQGIATITLNRPRQMNSFNMEIIQEMLEAIDICGENREVRAVVLTGAGEVFSAGDDIRMMEMFRDLPAEKCGEVIETQAYPLFIKKIRSLPKPVIASVNGLCYGAGGEIALACDYILASNRASFGQLYINVGLIGNTYLLPRIVGARTALKLIWTGKIISAEEAYELGMVDLVVVPGQLEESTNKIARQLADMPSMALGLAKKAVYEGLDMDLDDGLHLMCQMQGELIKSEDHQEGVAAFLEKRKPVFGKK